MKKQRSGVILILLGVMVAVLVAVIVFSVTRQAAGQEKVETTEVVVAARDIPARTLILAEALAVKRLPVDAVPIGAVGTVAQAVGKMTVTAIYPGEMILTAKLADTNGGSGMAFALEKGNVLITFPASDIITTGALRTGDAVDILVTYKGPSQNSPGQAALQEEAMPPTTQATMQNMKIVSIGDTSAKAGSGGGGNLLTFAMEHQDALLLKALKDADGVGLEIVLRAAGDEEIVRTQPVTMRTIIERYRLRSP